MAAPTESLPSLRHLTDKEQNAFTRPKVPSVKKRPELSGNEFSVPISLGNPRVMYLQRRWQELQDRERIAQQHNRQLLQQFEKAQNALEDMMARNAAMKTIRMEYERYLEDNSQRWQEQLAEKTQAAQKKKMEEHLRSYMKKMEEEHAAKSTADEPLLSQGPSTSPQKNVAPQVHSTQQYFDYSEDYLSHHPYIQSWLTHVESQTGRSPIRVPYQPHSSPLFFPPNFQQPHHPFLLHHFTSPHNHQNPWPGNNAASWAPSQQPYPWPWAPSAAGIPPGSWGQLYTEEPPSELRAAQTGGEDETNRARSTKRESSSGSRSSRLSQELDIKPVRLSSSHAESSGSGRNSSLTSREKRKKTEKSGKAHSSSSERERCDSQESSRASSKIVIDSGVALRIERNTSSEEGTSRSNSTKRSRELSVASPRFEKVMMEKTKTGRDLQSHEEKSQKAKTPTGEESRSSGEELVKEEGNQGHDDSGSCRTEEESESDSVKIVTGASGEAEKRQSSSSEQSSTEENDQESNKNLTPGEEEEEKEHSLMTEEEEDSDVEEEDDDVSGRKNTTDEEVENASEDKTEERGDDEPSNKLNNKDDENRKEHSSSSQDEDGDEEGSEGSEDKMEEEGSNEEGDEESEEEEEHRSDEANDENSDSDDSIISPQENRPKQQNIPEEAAEDEDEEEGKMRSSTVRSSEVSDDDIENLLAPEEQKKMAEEKDLEADVKTKAICHNVDIFRVTEDRPKTDHQSDSDEFDHFYD